MSDARDLYVRSAGFAQQVLGQVDPSTYDRPTPCEGWDVREAINHLIGGQDYFAGAAAGQAPDNGDGPPDHTMGDPADAHVRVASAVTTAFTDEVLAGTVSTFRGDIPGGVLLAIATMENVVHALDVGRGAGLDPQVPEALAEPVLGILGRLTAGGAGEDFAAPVDVPDDASPTDRILALSGRTP